MKISKNVIDFKVFNKLSKFRSVMIGQLRRNRMLMNHLRTKLVLIIFICLHPLIISTLQAEETMSGLKIHEQWWWEIETDLGWSRNDFYVEDYEDYFLGKIEMQAGMKLTTFPKGKSSINASFNPYVKFKVIKDFGTNEPWNDNDWNNNIVYGGGVRLQIASKPVRRLETFTTNVFAEYLKIDYLPNVESYTGHRPDYDVKYGFESWIFLKGRHEKQKLSWRNWWLEISIGFSYSRTNFFVKEKENFSILGFSPSAGMQYKSFSLYYRTELKWDAYQECAWNDVDFNNFIKYGPGLRFNLYEGRTPVNLKSTKIFAYIEYLNVWYLPNVDYVPSYRPEGDVLVGIRSSTFLGGKGI